MITARVTSIPRSFAIRSTRSYANGFTNSPFPKNFNESGRQVPGYPGGQKQEIDYFKWGSIVAGVGILGYFLESNIRKKRCAQNMKKEKVADNPMSKDPNADAIVK